MTTDTTFAQLAKPERQRPINCGTGHCSCIECVMEPERKPMTDGDKLYAMWHSSDANDLDDFLDGWRHAEAFHGIKEKP